MDALIRRPVSLRTLAPSNPMTAGAGAMQANLRLCRGVGSDVLWAPPAGEYESAWRSERSAWGPARPIRARLLAATLRAALPCGRHLVPRRPDNPDAVAVSSLPRDALSVRSRRDLSRADRGGAAGRRVCGVRGRSRRPQVAGGGPRAGACGPGGAAAGSYADLAAHALSGSLPRGWGGGHRPAGAAGRVFRPGLARPSAAG